MALSAPFTAVANRAVSAARSAVQTVALYIVIGLLGLTGLGFLLAALFIWIAANSDPLAAALLMGTGLLAVAGIALAIVIARGQKQKKQRERQTANTALIASTVSLATTGLRIASRAKGPLFWPALAAIAVGWYFGTSGGSDDEDD